MYENVLWAKSNMVEQSVIELIAPLHPEEALKFLVLVFAEWAEQEYQKRQGNFDKVAASYYFLDLLIQNSSTGLPPVPGLSRKPRAMIDASYLALEKQSRAIASQLAELSPNDAMQELADITTAWAYSIPENCLDDLPFDLADHDEKTIATAINNWFVRHFSMFF